MRNLKFAGLAVLLSLSGCSWRPQARLERGKYVVENLGLCLVCHSEINWKAPAVPVMGGKLGGGDIFPDEGLPFKIVAPNISPDPDTGVGKWSDEQLARAIRDGIGQDGRVLHPIMPYMFFRTMSDDDLASAIAYLRSIPPVKNAVARIDLPPPVKQSLKALPPVGKVAAPDLSTPEKRGAYLATVGICAHCHTPLGPGGAPRMDLAFGGGFILKGPWGGEVASANLTPDPSGISYYTEASFLEVMRTGHVKARKLNEIMPTSRYKNLSDEDLKGIFAFLKTLKPVQHRVDNTEPPTPCKRCGSRHGLGARNEAGS